MNKDTQKKHEEKVTEKGEKKRKRNKRAKKEKEKGKRKEIAKENKQVSTNYEQSGLISTYVRFGIPHARILN